MALLYIPRSITSMYLPSPVARNRRWFSVMNISTAHVSEYAEMFGSDVRLAESFVAGGADAAGDVHLLLDGVGHIRWPPSK